MHCVCDCPQLSMIAEGLEKGVRETEGVQDMQAMQMKVYAAFMLLFAKYVDNRAALEVNISWALKNEMYALFGPRASVNTPLLMLPSMEAAAKEISHLMRDSATRYFREC